MLTALKDRKLVDTKNLQEATKILDAKNIGKTSAIRKLVGLAYKMTDDTDKKHTLQEADESAMGKEEPYAERGGQKNAPKQKEEDEINKNEEARNLADGDSNLHGEPSGNPGSDVPESSKLAVRRSEQENAVQEPGVSQLGGEGKGNKENMPYYQMMQEPSPDMLNNKVIELMDPSGGPGLSKVAAEQAVGNDTRNQMGFMQEALKPVLSFIEGKVRKLEADNLHLREAIDILKTSKEAGRIQLMKPGGPGGNKNQEALNPGVDPTVSESANTLEDIQTDSIAKEAFQKDILELYC